MSGYYVYRDVNYLDISRLWLHLEMYNSINSRYKDYFSKLWISIFEMSILYISRYKYCISRESMYLEIRRISMPRSLRRLWISRSKHCLSRLNISRCIRSIYSRDAYSMHLKTQEAYFMVQ